MLDGFLDEGLADVWTPVAFSREVGKRPVAVTVASERVVLFRGQEGKVAALVDRCPHRGVALSLGKVDKDGCLQCPFHGWRFKADGACAHVPFNPLPAEKLRNLGATAFPVRERGGLIWMYTRPGAEAPEEPHVPAELEDSRFSVWCHEEVWKTHWSRAMENMLDAPHLPFVHGTTIGWGMRRKMRPDSRMEVVARPTATGMRVEWKVDNEDSPSGLDWMRPNGMRLEVRLGKRTAVMNIWCVPQDSTRTRMLLAGARDFGQLSPVGLLFDQNNRIILMQDRAIVESSSPAEVPHPSEERSVATDRATLAFRRWYLERKRTGHELERPRALEAVESPALAS